MHFCSLTIISKPAATSNSQQLFRLLLVWQLYKKILATYCENMMIMHAVYCLVDGTTFPMKLVLRTKYTHPVFITLTQTAGIQRNNVKQLYGTFHVHTVQYLHIAMTSSLLNKNTCSQLQARGGSRLFRSVIDHC